MGFNVSKTKVAHEKRLSLIDIHWLITVQLKIQELYVVFCGNEIAFKTGNASPQSQGWLTMTLNGDQLRKIGTPQSKTFEKYWPIFMYLPLLNVVPGQPSPLLAKLVVDRELAAAEALGKLGW